MTFKGLTRKYQERELERVNAFYLQKEAEVWACYELWDESHPVLAQATSENVVRQEESHAITKHVNVQAIYQLYYSTRRI